MKKVKVRFKNLKNLKDGYYWADVVYTDQSKGKEIISLEVFNEVFHIYGFHDTECLSTTETEMGMQVKAIYPKRIKFNKGK